MVSPETMRVRVRAEGSDVVAEVEVPASTTARELLERLKRDFRLADAAARTLVNETKGFSYGPDEMLSDGHLEPADILVASAARPSIRIRRPAATAAGSTLGRIVVGRRGTSSRVRMPSRFSSETHKRQVRIATRGGASTPQPVEPVPGVLQARVPQAESKPPALPEAPGEMVGGTGPDPSGEALGTSAELHAPSALASEYAREAPPVPDEERFKRLVAMGWRIDVLRGSTVLVAGVGALGNEAAKNAALAGIGTVILVDMDAIEGHNLTRTALFRPGDIGQAKCVVAAKRVQEMDPLINAVPLQGPLQRCVGLGVYRRMDLVLGCLDNLQARRDINIACIKTGTPFIDAGLEGLRGDVRTFFPPFEVCFDCTITDRDREEEETRWQCLKLLDDADQPTGPTAPTISSMVAGLQMQIALKHLHRDVELPGGRRFAVPEGRRIVFNGYTDDYGGTPGGWELLPDRSCPTHPYTSAIEESLLVELPLRSRYSTARELLKGAQELLGPDAYIDLASFNGFELVTGLTCPRCGSHEEISQRYRGIRFREAVCPSCSPIPELCPRCRFPTGTIFKEYPGLVSPDGIVCPECRERTPVVLRDREQHRYQRIEKDSPLLERTLSELTIPPLEILLAVSISEDPEEPGLAYRYLELTGDEDEVFGPDRSPRTKPIRRERSAWVAKEEYRARHD